VRRRCALAVGFALALACPGVGAGMLWPTSAAADPTGGGDLGPDYVRATASDLGSGTFPGAGLPAREPSTEAPVSWSRRDEGARCVVFAGPVPPELQPFVGPLRTDWAFDEGVAYSPTIGAPPGAVAVAADASRLPPDATVVGELVSDIATARGSTAVLVVSRCVQPGEGPPPDAPSPAEVWEQTPLPRPVAHASPPGTTSWPGITGLTTYVWGDAPGPVTASVELRGFHVTVTARPVAYGWAFGNGTALVTDGPGSAAAPARVLYERRGDYAVRFFVVWQGTYTATSDWGIGVDRQDLGTVTLPGALPYHVAEVRSLLRRSRPRS
jgi:hypothetical protein